MKSNKKIKAMLIGILAEKYMCKPSEFWFDGAELWVYEPPMGYCEGDEVRFWWHWYGQPYVSIDGNGHPIAVCRG